MKFFFIFLFLFVSVAARADEIRMAPDLVQNEVWCTGSLATCVSNAGANNTTLKISTSLSALSGNLTIPSNVTLDFTGGGQASCGSSVLTIQSSTANWPSQQIFASDCDAGEIKLDSWAVKCFRPEWWGGTGANTNDDNAAIQKMMVASNEATKRGAFCFGAGTWDISQSIPLYTDSIYQGSGAGATVIQTDTSGDCFPIFRSAGARSCTGGSGSCDSDLAAGTRGDACPCYTNADCQSGTCGAAGTVQRRIKIENMRLHLRDDYCMGIDASLVGESTFENLYLTQSTGTHNVGVYFTDAGTGGYSNSLIESSISSMLYGVRIGTEANDTRILNNPAINLNTIGIKVDNPANAVRIEHNGLQSNTTYGVEFNGQVGRINYNRFEDDTTHIYIESSATAPEIRGNYHGSSGTPILFQSVKPLGTLIDQNRTSASASTWIGTEWPGQPDKFSLIEEFTLGSLTSGTIGALGWTTHTIGTAPALTRQTPTEDHPSIMNLATNAAPSAGQGGSLELGAAAATPTFNNLGTTNGWVSYFTFKLAQTTATRAYIGLINDFTTLPPTKYVGLRYDTATGIADSTFKFVCTNGGSQTVQDSGVSADTGWHTVLLKSQAGGSTIIASFDNGITAFTLSSNCPTAQLLAPTFMIGTDAAAQKSMDIDFWSFYEFGLAR